MTLDPAIQARRLTPPVRLDAQGRIDEDIPCRKCAYNLRSLLPDGRCPECGTAVGRSLQGDYLRFADPIWVATLASGMNWVVAGIVIGIVTGSMGGGTMFCVGSRPGPSPWFVLPGLAIGLVAVIGFWKVTVPDPSGLGEGGHLNARKLLRFCQIAKYAIGLTLYGLAFAAPVALLLGTAIETVLGIVGAFAGFLYARRLALRIPEARLARSCRIVMWGAGAVMLLAGVLGVVGAAFLARSAAVTAFGPVTTAPVTPGALGYVSTTSSPASPRQATWSSDEFEVTNANAPTSAATRQGGRRVVVRSTAGTVSGNLFPRTVMVAFWGLGCVVAPLVLLFGIWSILIVVKLRKALHEASRQALAGWAASGVKSVRVE